jgi:hypothetical protein
MCPSTSTNDRGIGTIDPTAVPKPIRAGAFWAAVLLPFCTPVIVGLCGRPALLAGGIEGIVDQVTFVGLLVGNVVALVVGHGYGE